MSTIANEDKTVLKHLGIVVLVLTGVMFSLIFVSAQF